MTESLIKQGQHFLVTAEDFDAGDVYTFVVKQTEPALEFGFTMRGEETEQTLTIPAQAVAAAPGVLNLSQGGFTGLIMDATTKKREYVSPKESDPSFVPPFLLSREQFAAAKESGAVELQPLWDFPDVDQFTVAQREKRSIDVHGKKVDVDVLVLKGTESTTTLTVVDDAKWPLILDREECDGGNVQRIAFTTLTDE